MASKEHPKVGKVRAVRATSNTLATMMQSNTAHHPLHMNVWRPLLGWAVALLSMLSSQAFAVPESGAEALAHANKGKVTAGDQFVIAVVLDHAEGWHSHTNEPKVPASWARQKFEAIPTTIEVESAEGMKYGPIQWPQSHEVFIDLVGNGRPEAYRVFEGRAIAYVPVVVDAKAKVGARTINVRVGFQSCDDKICTFPKDEVIAVGVEVIALGAAADAPSKESDFAGFDPSVFSKMLSGEVKAITKTSAAATFDFLGWKFTIDGGAYWLIFLIAFVAGFLLNLTPCVLPVIPLKILSLQKQASHPGKLALFGTVYCLGIVATFFALGLLMFGLLSGGQKQDWGQIFTNRWFTIGMSAIVLVMGVGMMGLFTIRLPQAVYMVNPSSETTTGNFLMGVLTAILSTPCTGPLLGATIAWAATQPAWIALATLVVMGIGMAAPYAVLIAFPGMVSRLPKAGPGGELLKQVLGIFLIAVGVFLASNLVSEKWPWWVIGGIVGVACVWAIVGAWRMLRTPRGKMVVTGVASLALVGTVFATRSLADEGPLPWKTFANKPDGAITEAIQAELAKGKIVVVDFTAKWCTNCHVIEKTVLASDEGVSLLTADGVSLVKVDLSVASETHGWGVVRQISGGGGIPLVAVYRPGQAEPTYFQSFFKVSDLARAMGREGTAK
jgi:thiol:disulfide interchange protein DsbD